MFNKKNVFFSTLEVMSSILVEASAFFKDNVAHIKEVETFHKQIKNYESASDKLVHDLLVELNKTFITPIEREDIQALMNAIDDVLDGLNAVAARIDMYNIVENDPYVAQFADNIYASSLEIQAAISLLASKKLLAIRPHTIKLNQLESASDDVLLTSMKHIFNNIKDPIDLIKHKEIYERLEKTTDYCEKVANTLETIIMRNS